MAQQGTHDRSIPAGDHPPPEPMLLKLARKQFGTLSRAEEELFRAAEEGRRAFALAGDGWDNNPANVANWNADRVARDQCITWLCTDPRESALVTHHGLDLYGVQIDAELDLSQAELKFSLAAWECAFSGNILLQDAQLRTLSLTNCYIKGGLKACWAKIGGSFLLRDGFKAEGEVRLLWRDPPRRVRLLANRCERKAPLEPRSFTELRVGSSNIFYLR